MKRDASWPHLRAPDAPFVDEAPEPWTGFSSYCKAGGTLSEADHDALVREVRARLDDVAAGRRRVDDRLRTLLARLRVRTDLVVDRRTERPVPPWIPTAGQLARIVTDVCPAAAGEACDRVLGPLADMLEPHVEADRATLLAAVAGYAFSVADGDRVLTRPIFEPGLTAFERWSSRQPIPPVEHREAIRAVGRAPWSVWSLERAVGDRWVLGDQVGLGPGAVPDQPVRLLDPGAPFREPRPGDTVAARVVEGPDGWVACCPIVVPGGPAKAMVRDWVRLELTRGRLLDRRLTVDQLLRRRGHELVRRLVEWAWVSGDDDPYRDPALYDLEYRGHDEDLVWYLELARRARGSVLELGCGTGRLLLHLARHGISVRGVDRSASMLAGLRAKLAREPADVRARVRFTRGDFTALPDLGRHPLVLLPFNAVHHCRSEEEVVAVLEGIRACLAPGGRVGFDCYLPDLELYDRDPLARYEPRDFIDPRSGGRMRSWEQGWWDAERRIHHVLYVYEHPGGRREHAHLQLRMFELDELRALFARAGLTVVSEARDFAGRPLGSDALKYVAVLRA